MYILVMIHNIQAMKFLSIEQIPLKNYHSINKNYNKDLGTVGEKIRGSMKGAIVLVEK